MKKKINTKTIVISALLVALSIIVPSLSLPVIPIPEFSVTLFAHVPVILGMFINPIVALLAALGSALGFFFAGKLPVVVVRALSHAIFAVIGGFMLLKMKSKYKLVFTYLVTTVLHVVFEIVVIAFLYQTQALTVALTMGAPIFALHHTFDFVATVVVYYGLERAKLVDRKLFPAKVKPAVPSKEPANR